MRAESVGADTQLSQMLDLVERAQNQKAAVQRVADRVAGYFVPAVLALAVGTLGGLAARAARGGEQALNAALSVLIIACPCALGLATPMALVVASDRGARSGIFFKGYEAVESSGRVDTVLFDKTGTITDGRMSVVDIAASPGFSEQDVMVAAASLERASEHPVGRAIVRAANAAQIELDEVRGVRGLGRSRRPGDRRRPRSLGRTHSTTSSGLNLERYRRRCRLSAHGGSMMLGPSSSSAKTLGS